MQTAVLVFLLVHDLHGALLGPLAHALLGALALDNGLSTAQQPDDMHHLHKSVHIAEFCMSYNSQLQADSTRCASCTAQHAWGAPQQHGANSLRPAQLHFAVCSSCAQTRDGPLYACLCCRDG